MRVTFTVNGALRDIDADPLARLIDLVRDDLGLTGTKEGCGEGECGACTVLLDGSPVASCLVPACQADGHAVTTVEGLAPDGVLDRVQEALVRHGAVQCGFCTPGIVMAVVGAHGAGAGAGATDAEKVRELLAGNLCRCTGYQFVVDAVVDALASEDRR